MQGADLLQAEELGSAGQGSQEGDSNSGDSAAESETGVSGSDCEGSQGGLQLQPDADSENDTDGEDGTLPLRQRRGARRSEEDSEQAQPSGSAQETDDARHASHGSDAGASDTEDGATHSEGSGAEGEDLEAASDSDGDEALSAEESDDGRPRKAVRQKKRPASSQADRWDIATLPARACRLPEPVLVLPRLSARSTIRDLSWGYRIRDPNTSCRNRRVATSECRRRPPDSEVHFALHHLIRSANVCSHGVPSAEAEVLRPAWLVCTA